MDNLRIEEIRQLWDAESEAPETQEWRDSLTPEELDYVSGLDRSFRKGFLAMAWDGRTPVRKARRAAQANSAILVREKVRKQFRPQEIVELETVYDHCRLRLRDGRTLLWDVRRTSARLRRSRASKARLDADRSLQLDEVDGVC